MQNDDLVKCPLCGGFTHVDSPELLTALSDPGNRARVQSFVAELLGSPVELAGVSASSPPKRDINKAVHSWNPNIPMWSRSPKE